MTPAEQSIQFGCWLAVWGACMTALACLNYYFFYYKKRDIAVSIPLKEEPFAPKTTSLQNMTATSSANYDRLLNEVLALPTEERKRFTYDLNLFITQSETPPSLVQEKEDVDNLRGRAMKVYTEVLEGKTHPAEEMEARLEAKYSWLCE